MSSTSLAKGTPFRGFQWRASCLRDGRVHQHHQIETRLLVGCWMRCFVFLFFLKNAISYVTEKGVTKKKVLRLPDWIQLDWIRLNWVECGGGDGGGGDADGGVGWVWRRRVGRRRLNWFEVQCIELNLINGVYVYIHINICTMYVNIYTCIYVYIRIFTYM